MWGRAGKLSGRSALRSKLTSLGYDLPAEQVDDLFKRFKVRPAIALTDLPWQSYSIVLQA